MVEIKILQLLMQHHVLVVIISFTKYYHHVLGIELDQKRYEMLLHNWNVINNNVNDGNGSSSESMTNSNNTKNDSSSSIVEFINDCCISTLKKKIEQTTTYHRFFDMPHIVFFDPPWGGTNYISKHVLSNLMLSNIELKDVIGMAFHGNDDGNNNEKNKNNNNNNNCKAVVCKYHIIMIQRNIIKTIIKLFHYLKK